MEWIMIGHFVLVIIGFILLAYGGNEICKGAVGIAAKWHLNPLFIGMTVVAMSTSAPELVTSLLAAWKGKSDMVIGNVLGSNLVNIGCAGGLVALIRPFHISSRVVRVEMPFLLIITLCLGVFSFSHTITSFQGSIFLLLAAIYILSIYIWKEKTVQINKNFSSVNAWVFVFRLILGCVCLLLGSEIVIDNCIYLAKALHISDTLISFSVIAIGTSAPEIATSLVAALKGYGEICIGNIVGSNIFNTLLVIGGCAVFRPLTVAPGLRFFEVPGLIFLTTLSWRFFTTGREVNRLEGAIIFGAFLGIFLGSIYLQINRF